jgi:hypothetical protein
MSIDHTFNIGADGSCQLVLNMGGVDVNGDLSSASSSIYAFDQNTGVSKFTCNLSIEQLSSLYHHLAKYSMVTSLEPSSAGKFIEVAESQSEIISFLSTSTSESLIPALQHIVSERLSHDDINTILGRRESLAEYEGMLADPDSFTEPDWQKFFERNEWIFGYGLTYKYITILQREAHVSSSDLNGANDVITDFLVSDSRFTKIVELKTPKTALFERSRNRADSWRLSMALTDAVSQILAQKANWEIESDGHNYTAEGELITEKAYDVQCILVIGSHSNIDGTARDKTMKSKTLELYRRNLRCIEILTYDELFERAKYIVKGAQ